MRDGSGSLEPAGETDLTVHGREPYIVVLGAAVQAGGRPGPALARRVRHAVGLYHRGCGGALVLTGDIGRHPPAEAVVMARLAREGGVPEDRLVLESQATSTYESARRCAALLPGQRRPPVILVSDGWHLRRALLAFRGFGLDCVGSAADGPLPRSRNRIYRRTREALALVLYAARLRLRAR